MLLQAHIYLYIYIDIIVPLIKNFLLIAIKYEVIAFKNAVQQCMYVHRNIIYICTGLSKERFAEIANYADSILRLKQCMYCGAATVMLCT